MCYITFRVDNSVNHVNLSVNLPDSVFIGTKCSLEHLFRYRSIQQETVGQKEGINSVLDSMALVAFSLSFCSAITIVY